MLQAINDRIKGWLGIAVVILIGLPFALWGIKSYLDDNGPRYAAKVNKSEISANEFERMVSLQRQSLLRQNNGKLPVEDKVLRERTLTQLINQRLLEGYTFDNGYRISDVVLSERIKQLFTVDGVFDRERFESSVASYGMNIPMYEHTLRNELRLQQMQSAIVNSTFITKEEVNNLAALSEQTRDISVLTFNVEHFSTASKPTEDEVKQYYEANLQQFMMPEKIKVDYVEITSEALAETVTVDESQVKKMYDDYVASASGREERKARHILIQAGDNKAAAKAKIESIKQELAHGANFAELAKKYSQDSASASQGGDLGWVASGEMVKPFEQALFEMKKGSVSDIVETQFGYHLIELDDIRSETVAPFDVKRYEFEDELKAEAAASMFYDLSERLASTAYENPSSLDAVVAALDLKVKTSDYFTRSSGEGIAADEKIRNVAFSPAVLEQGNNSDIIELNPKHVVVLRLNEHIPATAIPLEKVSSKIENILKIKNGHEQTRAAALDIKSKIEAGTPVKELTAEGFVEEDIASLGRNDKTKVSDPSILYNAFDMPPNQDNKPSVRVVDLISGDVALVVLTKVNLAENIPQDKLDLVRSEVLSEEAVRDFSSALLAIREKADIDKNKNIVER
jgi:peptidyl-prolyl cis-trans isomerase D